MTKPSYTLPLTPKRRVQAAVILSGLVILLFIIALAGFLSGWKDMREVVRDNQASRLANEVDTDFQLAISKGKNFAILKDEINKDRAMGYFKKAQDRYSELSAFEEDAKGRDLLYKLGAALRSVEFSLGILTAQAKKGDSAEKLYRRYLKDITIDFDEASQVYVDYLNRRIQSAQAELYSNVRMGFWVVLSGVLLALGVMALSLSVVENLRRALVGEVVLKESEERLRLFDDLAEEAIMIHDQGLIVEVNRALTHLLGYDRLEIIGRHVSNFMAQASVEDTKSRIERGYPEDSYEITAKRKDGTTFPLLVHGHDFIFRGRKMRASSGWDITERKKAEEALKESEERFRKFAGVTVEGIMIHEAGIIVDVNQALLDLLKCESADFLGKDGLDFLSEESAKKVRSFRTEGYPSGPYELVVRRKDGTFFPAIFQGKGFEYDGKKLRVVSVWDITELKKAEEALWHSEENFRTLIEQAPDAILVNRAGKIVYANKRSTVLLGYGSKEELYGTSSLEIVHPDDRGLVLKRIERTLQGGENPSVEIRMVRRDGSLVEVESTSVGIRFEGSPSSMVILRDITDRKKAEEALRDSEEKFRSLIENSHDVISITGKDGLMSYISPSVKRVLGYDPAERIGRGYVQIMHPDDLERVKGEFAKLLGMPGASWTLEFRLRHKDGSWRHVESTGTNLLENPLVQGLVYNLRDITEKKQAEEAIRQKERYFRALIEKSYDAIALLDRNGSVRYASPGMRNIYGYGPEERLGQNSFDLVHPAERARTQELFARLIENPGMSDIAQVRFRHKDGHYVTLDVRATNLLEDPDVGGVVVNYRDVTGKKRAEEALREREEYYRALTENASDLIAVLDANAKVVYIGPAVKKMMGFSPEEREGRDGFETIHPDDQWRARGLFQKLIQSPSGTAIPFVMRLQHKDGRWRNVEGSGQNLLGHPSVHGIVVNMRDVTERVEAQEALTQSEENFRNLIENSNDVISVVGTDMNARYISSSIRKVMGYDPEERVGQSFLELVHPDDKAAATELFREFVSKPGVTVTAEVRALHKNGTWRNVDVVATNLLNHPAIEGIIFNYRDITEKKLAKQALIESEESFRDLIEKSPDAMLVHNPEKIIYVNEALLKLLKYEGHHQLLGKKPMVIVHPDDREAVNDRVRRLKPGEGYNPPAERRFLTRNGKEVPVEVVSFSIIFQGEPMVVAVARDLTERKLAEENFRNLTERSPDAILIHRTDKILYANPAFLKLTGYEKAEELVGKSPDVIVPPEERERVAERFKKIQQPDHVNPPAERMIFRKDGGRMSVEVVSFSLLFQGEMAAVVVMRDLTERKETEQTLMRFERLSTIGEMAAGIAHEIRNPLSAISAATQILKRNNARGGEKKPGSEDRYLETILEQTRRLDQLVLDTLQYARAEKPLEKEKISLKGSLEGAIRLCQVQFGPSHQKVKVEWDLPPKDLKLTVNPQRIQQILINLILNAYQIMPGGGVMKISLRSDNNSAFIRIEDTGPGIKDEDLKRIFEPFFTTKVGGSGLGLALSQRIAKEHGGEITLERVAPHGTAFTLRIPLGKG